MSGVTIKKLRDVVPREFFVEFMHTMPRRYQPEPILTPAARLLDVEVVSAHDGTVAGWPGPHQHVFVWWTLANGKRVGWNENPSKGWSFPVV